MRKDCSRQARREPPLLRRGNQQLPKKPASDLGIKIQGSLLLDGRLETLQKFGSAGLGSSQQTDQYEQKPLLAVFVFDFETLIRCGLAERIEKSIVCQPLDGLFRCVLCTFRFFVGPNTFFV